MAILNPPRPFKDDPPRVPGRRGGLSWHWQFEQLEDRILLSDGGVRAVFYGGTVDLTLWRMPKTADAYSAGPTGFAISSGATSSSSEPYGPQPAPVPVTYVTRSFAANFETAAGEAAGGGQLIGSATSPMPMPPSMPSEGPFAVARFLATAPGLDAESGSYGQLGQFVIVHGPRADATAVAESLGAAAPAPPFVPRMALAPAPPPFFPLAFRDDPGGDAPHGMFRVLFNAIQADIHRDKGGIGQSPDTSDSSDDVAQPDIVDLPPLFAELNTVVDAESGGPSAPLPDQGVFQATIQGSAAGTVSIWVAPSKGTDGNGDEPLPPIVLSNGEIVLGAFLNGDPLPELTAETTSALEELLGEPTTLSLPVLGRLQMVAELGPLDDSSFALAATLLTVTTEPRSDPADPGAAPRGMGPAGADTAETPSWAGFVIGLDEAFEANRQAAHEWPSASLATAPLSGAGLARQPADPTRANRATAPIDEAIRLLEREGGATPRGDDLFVPSPPQDKEAEADDVDRVAAGAVSLVLATSPSLLAGKLGPARRRRRERLDLPGLDDEDDEG